MVKVLFFVSIGLVVYTYAFYPAILFLLSVLKTAATSLHYFLTRRGRRIDDRTSCGEEYFPKVSLLLAARNEEELVSQKIENSLALDYPENQLELLIGSDASEDRTVEIVRNLRDPRVRLFDYRERHGKLGVLLNLLPEAEGEIVLLSDTNTFLEPEALRKMVRHFQDPCVGVVCGELRLTAPDGTLQSEGTYWRYETILKTLEGQLDCVLGANGGIYALRKELFPSIPTDTIVEDLVIPLKIRILGYRTRFESEAIALERNPIDSQQEFRRRVRIGAGCAQSISMIYPLLSARYGLLSFSLFSHKFVRWAVPLALPLAFLSNMFLISYSFFLGTFLIQILGYLMALGGWWREHKRRELGVFGLPYMFVLLNTALALGYVKYFRGMFRPTWERSTRVKTT